MSQLEEAIQAGIAFLAAAQLPDGSFPSLSSPSSFPFQPERQYPTVFATALILTCMNGLEDDRLGNVRRRAAAFLWSQQSPVGSWNYWRRESEEATARPYPDDLDDTFCSLAALREYDELALDGRQLAQAVKLLIATETQPGGPYRTWLVAASADIHWLDVDVVVNANVGRFLAGTGTSLAGLGSFLDDAIAKGSLRSPYYPHAWPAIWFLAQWYKGPRKTALLERAGQEPAETPLTTAMRLASRLLLGEAVDACAPDAERLLRLRQDGHWEAEGFCLDPAIEGRPYYAGSEALTTAISLQALALYSRHISGSNNDAEASFRTGVMDRVSSLFSGQPEAWRRLEPYLEKVQAIDGKLPILTLPLHVAQALGMADAQEALMGLGAAATLGWAAYTIFDDIIDGQPATEALPAALLALRAMRRLFAAAVPDPAFQEEVDAVLDGVDAANSWELAHCRVHSGKRLRIAERPEFGDHAQLAARSLGHALAGMGVLALSRRVKDMSGLKSFFKHLLIARQLSDDALDWKEDLRVGHINSVTAHLLADEPLPLRMPVQELEERLGRIFQERGFAWLLECMADHLRQADTAGEKLRFSHPEHIQAMAAPLHALVDKLRREQRTRQEFLAEYAA